MRLLFAPIKCVLSQCVFRVGPGVLGMFPKKGVAVCIRILVFIACVNLVLVAGAQTQDEKVDIESMSLEEMLNVEVVSASKFSQKMNEAPGVVSVVTAAQVRDYGWISLNDIITCQPGFFPSKDFERPTIGSRGLFEGWNNNHLLFLVDGIPFNDNMFGSAYTWEITPLFFLKSLEIIRGPGSALYGSHATNGVLSVNTIDAKDLEKKGILQVRLGNFNSQIYDLVAGSENKMFSYVLGFNAFRTRGNEYDGFDGSYRTGEDGNLKQFRVRDARSSSYFFGKIEGKKKLEGLSLQMHYQAWDFQTGYGWLWMVPDFKEAMKESRLLFSISYKTDTSARFRQEYALRYQRHNADWNLRLYPDGAFDNFYPAGTWEYLKTDTQDIFTRAQWAFILNKDATLLFGVEGTLFLYNGDEEHFSNTDLNDAGGFVMDDGTYVPSHEGWWAPFPGNAMRPMGTWFQWVDGKPVKSFGAFVQFASEGLLGKKFKATLGLRYDYQGFNFSALDKPGIPGESKSFSQFSPRLALVYLASKQVTVKALAGRAFRAPSPTEMFGTNSWVSASNLRQLEPELITTFELALDWKVNKNINFRMNGFYTKFENQIAYSVENNNLSTNIYTLTNAGVEAEVLFGFDNFSGFLNYSLYKRLDETIFDKFITRQDHRLTWAPAQTLNLGFNYKKGRLSASLQGHYQGKVKRRTSDMVEPLFVPLRPEHVAGWFSVNIKISWNLSRVIQVGISATNLFDSENYLIKNFSYPFDYKMMGRRIFSELRLRF